MDKKASRRKFLKGAAIGGVSLAVSGAVAKKIVTAASEHSRGGDDKPYLSRGDRALMEREYVEMSSSEKDQQVKMFIDNYKHEAV